MKKGRKMENKEEKKKDLKKEKKEKPPTCEEIIAEQKLEIADLKNKYLMAYADMENLRKQYEKEFANTIKYRASGFVDALMPVLDGFYHALRIEVDDEKVKNFLVGFQYIYAQLQTVLEQEGVTKLEPVVGDAYDINSMHALEAEESEEVAPNQVLKVLSCGYRLKDRLIRPAMVIVAKAKISRDEISEENLKN